MLARFSNLFYSEAPAVTRFDKCIQLKEIAAILAQLRTKEAELASAQEAKGAASIDYGKYTIIYALLLSIDDEIKLYNEKTEEQSREAELVDTRALVAAILAIVNKTLVDHKETLNKFRDNAHESLAKAINGASFLATVTAIYVSPLSIIPKLALYWGSTKVMPTVNDTIKENAGLNEEQTRTMIILTGLADALTQLDENLGLILQNSRRLSNKL